MPTGVDLRSEVIFWHDWSHPGPGIGFDRRAHRPYGKDKSQQL